jgi:hypothetical protein
VLEAPAKPYRLGGRIMTPQEQSYREISLTLGQVALVDSADFDWLNQWKWEARKSRSTSDYYAVRSSQGHSIRMHRLILGLEIGDRHTGDHQNLKTLDNRRGNLRIADCNHKQQRNKRKHSDNRSGFKGVTLQDGKYYARIYVNGKNLVLGSRTTAKAAHDELYVPAAIEHYGEFARF